MTSREMREFLFEIACHIVGYEDGEDVIEYVYEFVHCNKNRHKMTRRYNFEQSSSNVKSSIGLE